MSYVPPKPLAWNYCAICGRALDEAHDGERKRPYCPDCNRFYYRNPVPAACCFVQRGDDELLFTCRGVEPCKGWWTLPGGFMELGETSEEAALRELHEETGLRASRVRLIGVSTRQGPVADAILVLGYLIEDWQGDLRPGGDVSDLRFFAKHERPEVPFSVHRELIQLYDAL